MVRGSSGRLLVNPASLAFVKLLWKALGSGEFGGFMVRPRGEPPGAPPPRLRGSDSLLLLVAVVVSTSVSTPSSVLRRRVFLSETFRGVRVQKGSGRRIRDSTRGLHAPKCAMPQTKEKYLFHLTEVPAGWPLATVIDAFTYLAGFPPIRADASRALQAVSTRLVELWASQPAEAQAWRELHAREATRPEELCEALLRHGAAEFGKYGWNHWRFSEVRLQAAAEWRKGHAGVLTARFAAHEKALHNAGEKMDVALLASDVDQLSQLLGERFGRQNDGFERDEADGG
ncbi:hypothetical protein AK812_SmicGene34344 [Symbiodinium microadriaticum]|uniref:Uncharacterized protein n=1 Tax=Symbiodinium microadriaticum TaxID=2951 RepID=A0A1Q9CPA6_SYMMI|nr:hypothetical protein AK812_SmicGene34344 [Symbiodinium microadriaticum]